MKLSLWPFQNLSMEIKSKHALKELMNLCMIIITDLKIVFKENFRCPSDTESTREFLTMFKMASMKISTLLANWTQFIWETMATPGLVKLGKQLAQTIKKIKKKKERKAAKIMNFQLP